MSGFVSSEYDRALNLCLALDSAAASLHVARNNAGRGLASPEATRIQMMLSDVLKEQVEAYREKNRLGDALGSEGAARVATPRSP